MADKTEEKGAAGADFPGFDPKSVEAYLVKDPQALATNLAKAMENLGQAASAWLEPRESGKSGDSLADPFVDAVRTLSKVAEYWISEPQRTLEAQTLLLSSYIGIWTRSLNQFAGKPVEPEPEPPRKDRRFTDEDWTSNPFFAFLKQTYLVTTAWAEKLVTEAEGLDDSTREKALFYLKQVTAALSPSNFAFTNPEVYRQTVATSGANLVAGMRMLAEDIAAGGGQLRLRHTDATRFAIGHNMALTPGKVVARNELCEILQYEPTTETVLKRPLLIVPPWINKFYILDLTPEKSFIKWCVDQGHTVFVISWVNPDSSHAAMGWESYMSEGIDFALDTIEAVTSEPEVNAIGYCVGGTLLAATLAYHAQKKKNRRVASATFLTAQVDFTHAGDLKIFVDEDQIATLEKHMETTGYLAAAKMVSVFNMLRASELIWPYVVNNYLKGREPPPFDLLYWNSDATRLTAANHAYYLRNCYLNNRLSKGEMTLAGTVVSLEDITLPVFNLATREDHIAPAKSVFLGSALFGGPVEFVLSASGHIAGVINPPERKKYQFWTGGKPEGTFEDWMAAAQETKGSWWPHWQKWIEDKSNERVAARKPGGSALTPLGDAPGTYVLVRA
ncbi:PHA/PHB synthase family protein [Neorhizobium lilium]|uniref:PHA/PHB synthase family protein n=1 Tax=Neorhizobium lilium TaxID=2503024 RepID=UPI001FE11D43|nr:class I poly(R)-hydroxyalkanoic acid synthase [Neorhizobium lilium]